MTNRIHTGVGEIVALRNSMSASGRATNAQARTRRKTTERSAADYPRDRITFSPNARNRAAYGQDPISSAPDAMQAYRETARRIREALRQSTTEEAL